jgi:hypothetical protein
MNFDTLVKLSLEAAEKITGQPKESEETQEIAFKLACVAMAENASS